MVQSSCALCLLSPSPRAYHKAESTLAIAKTLKHDLIILRERPIIDLIKGYKSWQVHAQLLLVRA